MSRPRGDSSAHSRAVALACTLALGASGCARPPLAADAPAHAPSASARPADHAATAAHAPLPAQDAVGGPARGGGLPASALSRPDGTPRFDLAVSRHVRELFARGAAAGARPGVFAKLGDSITESGSFLSDIGHGWYELGPYTDLESTVAFFHQTRVDGDGNDSFAHQSAAATAGWTVDDALASDPPPTPVERELAALRPAWALIMFGTNDLDRAAEPDDFARGLSRIVDLCEQRGVVPVLSTIPARLDGATPAARVPVFNARIAQLARARHVPLMDLHAALARLPRQGVSQDGIHPSAFDDHGDTRAAVFTPAALAHGYNARNLLALRTLARLREVVARDGALDP